jgi:hypothetical protein
MVKPGKYKHYKGGIYRVLFTAVNSETNQPTVVYMNEMHGTYYTRLLKDFTSRVMEDSEDGGLPRFKYIGE